MKRKANVTLMVLLALAALAGTITGFPAVATAASQIYACVNNSSGTIHIVAAGGSCANNEVLLIWNTQGPAGAPGAGLQTGSIGGQVVMCSGSPAASLVYIPGRSFTAITGANGMFELSYVPPGTYNLVIDTPTLDPVTIPGIVVNTSQATSLGPTTVSNTTSDPNNCGACGHACATGQVCSAGVCSTPTASCSSSADCNLPAFCLGGTCAVVCCIADACQFGGACDVSDTYGTCPTAGAGHLCVPQ